MMRCFLSSRFVALLLSLALPAIAWSGAEKAVAPFAGTFTDQRLTLDLAESGVRQESAVEALRRLSR